MNKVLIVYSQCPWARYWTPNGLVYECVKSCQWSIRLEKCYVKKKQSINIIHTHLDILNNCHGRSLAPSQPWPPLSSGPLSALAPLSPGPLSALAPPQPWAPASPSLLLGFVPWTPRHLWTGPQNRTLSPAACSSGVCLRGDGSDSGGGN